MHTYDKEVAICVWSKAGNHHLSLYTQALLSYGVPSENVLSARWD